MDIGQNIVDDEGTGQNGAQDVLRSFVEEGFGGDSSKAGKALGRPALDIDQMIGGEADIDDDLMTKVRDIAKERRFEVK